MLPQPRRITGNAIALSFKRNSRRAESRAGVVRIAHASLSALRNAAVKFLEQSNESGRAEQGRKIGTTFLFDSAKSSFLIDRLRRRVSDVHGDLGELASSARGFLKRSIDEREREAALLALGARGDVLDSPVCAPRQRENRTTEERSVSAKRPSRIPSNQVRAGLWTWLARPRSIGRRAFRNHKGPRRDGHQVPRPGNCYSDKASAVRTRQAAANIRGNQLRPRR